MDAAPDISASTASVTSSTILRRLSTVDAAISITLHQHNFLPHAVFLLLELLADFRLFFPLALSVYLSPSLSSLLRPFLTPLILGLLVDLALVGIVKVIFRRPRPIYNKNMNVAVSVDHYSFPSGHSSRVFFIASLFCLSSQLIQDVEIMDRLVLGAWVWAVTTAVSRVLLGRHFVFDVFAGSCLGILEGLFAFHYLRLPLSFW